MNTPTDPRAALEALAAKWRDSQDNYAGGFDSTLARCADELTALLAALPAPQADPRAALEAIAALNPDDDSRHGFNEWGEAECFGKAQKIAREALAAPTPPTVGSAAEDTSGVQVCVFADCTCDALHTTTSGAPIDLTAPPVSGEEIAAAVQTVDANNAVLREALSLLRANPASAGGVTEDTADRFMAAFNCEAENTTGTRLYTAERTNVLNALTAALSGNSSLAGGGVGAALVRVGNLQTLNQDEYPGLGEWWVQLRIGPTYDEVLARVYGATPAEADARAKQIAAALSGNGGRE